jgi:hypothetical protein
MPALHAETTAREISKNVARMIVCMWMPSLSSRALPVLYLRRDLVFWFQQRSEVYAHHKGHFRN